MRKLSRQVCATLLLALAVLVTSPASAQTPASIAGVWTLNRSLSDIPREIGFNLNWLPPPDETSPSEGGGGGRGRRGSSGGNRSAIPNAAARESSEDARRLQLITGEARNPAARLMLVDTPGAVTITNELGQSRTLHPTGRSESLEIQGISFVAATKREGDELVVVYQVEEGRTVRYAYSHNPSPSQLIVDVQFLEHGHGDKARLVYEPAANTGTSSFSPAQPASVPPAAPAPPGGVPATGAASAESFDARPGAELRGLTSLGILVEDLSSQAVACGLNHDELESALSRRLADGGLTVKRNSDEDTYVYINVMTNSLPSGTCISRYDAFLYTHGTARLSYHDQPVLVQISLMHRGSIGSSSAPGTHAAAVTRGLEGYIDLFLKQIHDANK
jgi:hypothetical protein